MKCFKLLVLLIAPLLIVSSCKKSGVNPSTPGMSYKLNGVLIKTDSHTASAYKSEDAITMAINGFYNYNISTISLNLPRYEVGTYDVVKDKIILLYTVPQLTVSDFYSSNNGTVTIKSLSAASISGTFQFLATTKDGKVAQITEGQFNLPISYASY